MVPRDRWEGAAVVNCLHADGAAALAHAEGHPKGSPATYICLDATRRIGCLVVGVRVNRDVSQEMRMNE